ncbi:type II toxin-antitoxin system prevent-host-death family antitoxin [Sansalvadorimonas verongulae]|uniref:type II toxin-antitoxin system prevent-host-death family antitoxin n=1 Tax=Sansalvadorimonas verongulae TaxID=2172824 RepID=UPI0012BC7439|nr:type II toxin-antitoxin system prevent-host-death family antitoxin [Sansalvadorimonas verongulae]MTI13864.1 type II toxin-antitoxin system Phd/YefM family antitoxin [Sansalvadorimonas verongulae]
MTCELIELNTANLDVEGGGLIVTQNGTPKYVVESFEDYERREEAVALLKMVAMAKSDVQQGQVMNGEELRARLKSQPLSCHHCPCFYTT